MTGVKARISKVRKVVIKVSIMTAVKKLAAVVLLMATAEVGMVSKQ